MSGRNIAEMEDRPEQQSIWKSITLHLLPGPPVVAFYTATVRLVLKMGFPSFFALVIAIGVALPSLLDRNGPEIYRWV